MLSGIKRVVGTKWKAFRLLGNFAAGCIYSFIILFPLLLFHLQFPLSLGNDIPELIDWTSGPKQRLYSKGSYGRNAMNASLSMMRLGSQGVTRPSIRVTVI